MSGLQKQIAKLRAKHLAECIQFAEEHGYYFTQTLDEVPDGVQFYVVNLYNQMVTKANGLQPDELPAYPVFIVTDNELEPTSILNYIVTQSKLDGGKRKSRRNRKKIKSRKGKSRKNRRKSNRRRR